MGNDKLHLRCKIQLENKLFVSAIYFKSKNANKEELEQNTQDVVYTIEENYWQGEKTIQLNILDIRVSDSTFKPLSIIGI